MAVRKSLQSVDLKVDLKETIYLTITVGNAQIGGNVVRFKSSQQTLAKGEVQNLSLGAGNSITGKTLKVITNILDVNPQTNGVVVTYYFHSCDPAATMFYDTVVNDGDVFSFVTEFNFI